MECFKHQVTSAVGICKSCSKAICHQCAIENTFGITCSPECEIEANETNQIIERSKKIYGIGKYKTNKLASGVLVWLLLSAVMWLVSGINFFASHTPDYSTTAIAFVFSIITVIVYRSSKRNGINC